MQNLLRHIGALALGLTLGLSLAHVPPAQASTVAAAHHDGGDGHSGHDTPCDHTDGVDCATMGACSVAMPVTVSVTAQVTVPSALVSGPCSAATPSAHRAPDTPPPRA